jgi:hypothetical protein
MKDRYLYAVDTTKDRLLFAVLCVNSMSDYRKESWLINLPLYAIGQIQKECE